MLRMVLVLAKSIDSRFTGACWRREPGWGWLGVASSPNPKSTTQEMPPEALRPIESVYSLRLHGPGPPCHESI